VQRVRQLDGVFVRVTDDEILAAMKACGERAGVLAEPAAAASVAGVRRAVEAGHIADTEQVVAVITGNGLKDIRSAMRVAEGIQA
jgi:threonine synthase